VGDKSFINLSIIKPYYNRELLGTENLYSYKPRPEPRALFLRVYY
jgi:hypothetical protein